jgi:hypothetical protein
MAGRLGTWIRDSNVEYLRHARQMPGAVPAALPPRRDRSSS